MQRLYRKLRRKTAAAAHFTEICDMEMCRLVQESPQDAREEAQFFKLPIGEILQHAPGMKGQTRGFCTRRRGIQKTLLIVKISRRKSLGARFDTGPGFVKEDGVPLRGDPDMVKAQFNG